MERNNAMQRIPITPFTTELTTVFVQIEPKTARDDGGRGEKASGLWQISARIRSTLLGRPSAARDRSLSDQSLPHWLLTQRLHRLVQLLLIGQVLVTDDALGIEYEDERRARDIPAPLN